MTTDTVTHHFDPAGSPDQSPPSARGRLRRFVARHRLTEEERRNLRGYYRRAPVHSPPIVTAALGGHPELDWAPRR